MRQHRRGFTLTEILVVIGVIVVLVSIAVVGYTQLDRTVSGKATKATLQNASGLVDEFAAINGTGLLESYWTAPPTPQPAYIDPSQSTPISVSVPLASQVDPSTGIKSGDVSIFAPPYDDARFSSAAVVNTQTVMEILERIPRNLQAMEQMPRKQLLASSPFPKPMLTDAWRNPIIFVPAGGLTGVIVNYKAATQQTITVQSPDGRPFWASAGPDGDFSKGDDNIYSFQN